MNKNNYKFQSTTNGRWLCSRRLEAPPVNGTWFRCGGDIYRVTSVRKALVSDEHDFVVRMKFLCHLSSVITLWDEEPALPILKVFER